MHKTDTELKLILMMMYDVVYQCMHWPSLYVRVANHLDAFITQNGTIYRHCLHVTAWACEMHVHGSVK